MLLRVIRVLYSSTSGSWFPTFSVCCRVPFRRAHSPIVWGRRIFKLQEEGSGTNGSTVSWCTHAKCLRMCAHLCMQLDFYHVYFLSIACVPISFATGHGCDLDSGRVKWNQTVPPKMMHQKRYFLRPSCLLSRWKSKHQKPATSLSKRVAGSRTNMRCCLACLSCVLCRVWCHTEGVTVWCCDGGAAVLWLP